MPELLKDFAVSIAAALFIERLPKISEFIIGASVNFLEPADRQRYKDEWLADLQMQDGPISGFFYAISIMGHIYSIKKSVRNHRKEMESFTARFFWIKIMTWGALIQYAVMIMVANVLHKNSIYELNASVALLLTAITVLALFLKYMFIRNFEITWWFNFILNVAILSPVAVCLMILTPVGNFASYDESFALLTAFLLIEVDRSYGSHLHWGRLVSKRRIKELIPR